MAYVNGVTPVGTASTLICTPTMPGDITLQALGTAPATGTSGLVFIGGPNIGANAGVVLQPATSPGMPSLPVRFPVLHYGGFDNPSDAIYGCTNGGTVNVAFVMPA